MKWGKMVTNTVLTITESFSAVLSKHKNFLGYDITKEGTIKMERKARILNAGEYYHILMYINNGADNRLYTEYMIRKEFI